LEKYDYVTREIDNFISDIKHYTRNISFKLSIIRNGNETYSELIIKLHESREILRKLKTACLNKKRKNYFQV